MIDYINEYCNETISEIHFRSYIENIDRLKPFTNAKTVLLKTYPFDYEKKRF